MNELLKEFELLGIVKDTVDKAFETIKTVARNHNDTKIAVSKINAGKAITCTALVSLPAVVAVAIVNNKKGGK